ncbi:hypothetical protein MJD09_10005 [bacterium]|nr:hypothetical protein [bacterium]
MKKFAVISIVLILLLSLGCAARSLSSAEKKKSEEMVVLEIDNMRFSPGRVYIANQQSARRYLGRVSPGQSNSFSFSAPIDARFNQLIVTVNGQVTNWVELSGTIKAGDRIEWDLLSNDIVWKGKEAETKAK